MEKKESSNLTLLLIIPETRSYFYLQTRISQTNMTFVLSSSIKRDFQHILSVVFLPENKTTRKSLRYYKHTNVPHWNALYIYSSHYWLKSNLKDITINDQMLYSGKK